MLKDSHNVQLVRDVLRDVEPESAHAVLVAVEQAPMALYHEWIHGGRGHIASIDCFSDAYGWMNGKKEDVDVYQVFASSSPSSTPQDAITGGLEGLLTRIEVILSLNTIKQTSVIVFDCMSPFLLHFGARKVRLFLDALRAHAGVRCVVSRLHTDLHSPEEIATIEHGISCCLELEPGWGLLEYSSQSRTGSVGGMDPHGTVHIQTKRAHGCKKTDMIEYRVNGSTIAFEKLQPKNAGRAVDSTIGKESVQPPEVQLGGMKLELTQEEIEAKTRVTLPFEHQGKSSLYKTDDYRDYLPPEAGGHGPGGGKLGHILYVRDSDSEEPDSDEDPDDDLDI